jgi:lysozyme
MDEDLISMLQRHEGTGPVKNNRFLPYQDTVGKTTIGWGRNIADIGISREEAEFLLENDIKIARMELQKAYPWFYLLDDARQDAVIDMVFNLGSTKFAGFKNFHATMAAHDWPAAKKHMLDSLWAKQVGPRAIELAEMVLTGGYRR